MYDYITGTIAEISPAEAIIDNNGIGYSLQISLQTYSEIHQQKQTKLYIYNHVREDTHLWFGFATKDERTVFLRLISVSGIGPNSARVMLSSLSANEIRTAIIQGDVNKIKSVKGIGLKTAQKVIIELKDKIGKTAGADNIPALLPDNNSNREEALSALVMLGFAKPAVNKAIQAVLKANPNAKVEQIIKSALQMM